MNSALERKFIQDYYQQRESNLYAKPLMPLPENILELHSQGLYVEYAKAVRTFRTNS